MSRRSERVSEQVRAEIARILEQDVSDPRLRLMTLTRVKVSADLGNAVVNWSVLDADGGRDLGEVEAGLEKARSFIRRKLAESLSLRRTPDLHFRHDPSLVLGDRTLGILRDLNLDREGQGSDDET